jgi:urease accessory protein UreH
MTCYRITYRDAQYKEHTHPVISSSATQAVADLTKLGYQITRVTHSFPSV